MEPMQIQEGLPTVKTSKPKGALSSNIQRLIAYSIIHTTLLVKHKQIGIYQLNE